MSNNSIVKHFSKYKNMIFQLSFFYYSSLNVTRIKRVSQIIELCTRLIPRSHNFDFLLHQKRKKGTTKNCWEITTYIYIYI